MVVGNKYYPDDINIEIEKVLDLGLKRFTDIEKSELDEIISTFATSYKEKSKNM